MPRARNIKHDFFMNDTLAELSTDVRLLYIGLWTIADREGKLLDRPKKIKAQIFPFDKFNVDKSLQILHNACFIRRYEVNSMKYIYIPTFLKHQNPHHREQSLNIPSPNIEQPQPSPNLALTLPQPSPNLAGLNVECGMLNVESGMLNHDICSEPKKLGSDQVVKFIDVQLILNDKSLYIPTQEEVDHWIKLYAGVKVFTELKKMQGWLESHPTKRKTKRGIKSFITSWLSRAQDKSFRKNY